MSRGKREKKARYELHEPCHELVHEAADDCDARKDCRHCQGESPATSIGKNKPGDESSDKADDESDLFRHALLHEIWKNEIREDKMREERGHTGVGLNAGRDLPCADGVKVGDVLTEDGLEVLFTNAFGAYFASVNPNDHVDKCADKGTETFESISKWRGWMGKAYQCKRDMMHLKQRRYGSLLLLPAIPGERWHC